MRVFLTVATTLAGLTAMTSPALACSPALETASATPTMGEACAINWTLSEIRSVGLTPVTDLGGGRVMQFIYDGNACYSESNLLVQDCATGTAVVIGPDDLTWMDEQPRETGIDRIAAALRVGAIAGLEPVAGLAMTEGYPPALMLTTDATISINGQSLAISCACATFYPDMPRASQ
jgi:hypothetical protein